MISPELTHTEVQLTRGRAEVEVDQLYKQNDIQIDEQGQAVLGKDGLYAFNANDNTMLVFNGEAEAYEGNSPSNEVKGIEVKSGRELVLDGTPAKTTKFDKDVASNDELYKWSSLRSDYLGEANERLAEQYAWTYPGYGPFAAGWMWDPAFYSYTWLPGMAVLEPVWLWILLAVLLVRRRFHLWARGRLLSISRRLRSSQRQHVCDLKGFGRC